MLIAFQGGNVKAEIVDSALYFKARDLLAIINGNGNNTTFVYTQVSKQSNIQYRTDIEKVSPRPSKFIHISDVLNFLDNVNTETKLQTIFLMQEFLKQFSKYLKD